MENTHGTWGRRIRIFQDDHTLTTVLYLEPNKRCSWHYHNTRTDQFFVISGKMGVKTDKKYTTILTEGQSFTVEPGVKHEFQTYDKEAVVIEISYTKYDDSDIHRIEDGGDLKEKV